MSNLLHLPRPQIKTKLLDGPEVLSVAGDIPQVVSRDSDDSSCLDAFGGFSDLTMFLSPVPLLVDESD